MDLFLKITSSVLITVVICLVMHKNGAEMTMLISTAACSLIIIAAIGFLQPIVDFCGKLQLLGKLDGSIMDILLKAVGIGLLSQIVGMICVDSGRQALAKTLHFVAVAAILWLSLPLLEELIVLLDAVLGAV